MIKIKITHTKLINVYLTYWLLLLTTWEFYNFKTFM